MSLYELVFGITGEFGVYVKRIVNDLYPAG